MSEGIGTIAAAFYPKPVIVRLSDFKTNEYASLLGGKDFEAREANPMLGFRGASRYAHPAYEAGFALECQAVKRAREHLGLTNIRPMVPFCRRVEEAERVVAKMSEFGLTRGENGLEIYVMCEIPNNVILIDDFAKCFDGFSIGSNDLTQLALGVDRDSEIVAFDFDERDPGVLKLIELAVEGARRNGRHSGICGQAPSDYPEIAAFLVRLGIDSISLNPDSVLKTTMHVLQVERELGRVPAILKVPRKLALPTPWRNCLKTCHGRASAALPQTGQVDRFQAVLMSIFFSFLASSDFGSVTVKIPFLKVAAIFSAGVPSGSGTERWNDP